MVNQARALAKELARVAPNQADPEGVVRMLTTDNGSRASRSFARADVKPRPALRPYLVACLLLLASVIALLMGLSWAGNTYVETSYVAELEQIKWGNFLLGAGAGAGVCSLLLLWFASRISRS